MATCVLRANGGKRHDAKEEDIDREDLHVNRKSIAERREEMTFPVGKR